MRTHQIITAAAFLFSKIMRAKRTSSATISFGGSGTASLSSFPRSAWTLSMSALKRASPISGHDIASRLQIQLTAYLNEGNTAWPHPWSERWTAYLITATIVGGYTLRLWATAHSSNFSQFLTFCLIVRNPPASKANAFSRAASAGCSPAHFAGSLIAAAVPARWQICWSLMPHFFFSPLSASWIEATSTWDPRPTGLGSTTVESGTACSTELAGLLDPTRGGSA